MSTSSKKRSKVLIVGAYPLPECSKNRLTAPSTRTSQITNTLLSEGHEICLVCVNLDPSLGENGKYKIKHHKSLSMHVYEEARFSNRVLAKHEKDFAPDCIISISCYLPIYCTGMLKTSKPILFDTCGDIMSEAQLRASIENTDRPVEEFWKMLEPALLRGDAFSVISERTRFALIGALGAVGRLNKMTAGFEFIHVMPPSICKTPKESGKNVMRGEFVDNDDIVVLFSGSFNAWLDPETLYEGLELAMTKNPKIKFVVTAGGVKGQCTETFKRFRQMISKSRNKKRYIFRNWVPSEELCAYYSESNMGINIDFESYEALLGSRNRVLDWLAAKLPVISTATCELTEELANLGYIKSFSCGNSEEMAEAILEIGENEEKYKITSKEAAEYVNNKYSDSATTELLRKWVSDPHRAPDSHIKKPLETWQLSEVFKLKDKLKNLRNKLKSAKQEVMSLKEHASNLKKSNATLKRHTSQLERHVSNLERHVSNLEKHNADMEELLANQKSLFQKLKEKMRI